MTLPISKYYFKGTKYLDTWKVEGSCGRQVVEISKKLGWSTMVETMQSFLVI